MKSLWKSICSFFKRIAAAFKPDTKGQTAILTKVEDEEKSTETIAEVKEGKVAVKALSYIGKAAICVVAYFIVCNFPLTILLIMEMVAVYGFLNSIVTIAKQA